MGNSSEPPSPRNAKQFGRCTQVQRFCVQCSAVESLLSKAAALRRKQSRPGSSRIALLTDVKGKGTRSVANPCFATPRRRRAGMCEVPRTEQIPEREEFSLETHLALPGECHEAGKAILTLQPRREFTSLSGSFLCIHSRLCLHNRYSTLSGRGTK